MCEKRGYVGVRKKLLGFEEKAKRKKKRGVLSGGGAESVLKKARLTRG